MFRLTLNDKHTNGEGEVKIVLILSSVVRVSALNRRTENVLLHSLNLSCHSVMFDTEKTHTVCTVLKRRRKPEVGR